MFQEVFFKSTISNERKGGELFSSWGLGQGWETWRASVLGPHSGSFQVALHATTILTGRRKVKRKYFLNNQTRNHNVIVVIAHYITHLLHKLSN